MTIYIIFALIILYLYKGSEFQHRIYLQGLTWVFASPGAGKSTLLAKMCRKAIKKGKKVYSTSEIKGAYRITMEDIGTYDMSNSLIIIDEAGLEMGNRDFANFPKKALRFFKRYRHYHCNIVIASQAVDDVDKKVRDLCTKLIYCRKFFMITITSQIRKFVFIDKIDRQIKAGYKFCNPIMKGFIGFMYRPRWYQYFDSFEVEILPTKEFNIYEYKEIKKDRESRNKKNKKPDKKVS